MAQASSSRSGIQDLLECCICYEEYSDPRMLPCIHTFCLKCLEKTGMGIQPGDNMPCPVCRTAFKIPDAGIVGIQKNFFMESLIDMQHLIKVDSSAILCQACAEDSEDEVPHAVMLCVECDEKLCDGCCRSHKKFKLSKNHQLIDLKDKDMIKQRARNLIKRFCVRHKSKPIEMYCLDCESANCLVCQLESHQGHKCSDVDKVDKEFRMELQANNQNISQYSDLIKEEMNELDKYEMSFLNQAAKLQNDILKQATSIKEMVDQHVGELLQEIDSVKQTKQKEIQNKKEELIALVTMLESYEQYTAEIIEKGSSVDICRTFKEMNVRSDELQKNHKRAVTDVHSYLDNVLLLSLCPSKFVEGIHLKNTENMIGKLKSTEKIEMENLERTKADEEEKRQESKRQELERNCLENEEVKRKIEEVKAAQKKVQRNAKAVVELAKKEQEAAARKQAEAEPNRAKMEKEKQEAKELTQIKEMKEMTAKMYNAQPASSPLPVGWEERYDQSRKMYYYIDHINKQTSWTPPTKSQARSGAPPGQYKTTFKDEKDRTLSVYALQTGKSMVEKGVSGHAGGSSVRDRFW